MCKARESSINSTDFVFRKGTKRKHLLICTTTPAKSFLIMKLTPAIYIILLIVGHHFCVEDTPPLPTPVMRAPLKSIVPKINSILRSICPLIEDLWKKLSEPAEVLRIWFMYEFPMQTLNVFKQEVVSRARKAMLVNSNNIRVSGNVYIIQGVFNG